MKIAMLHVDLPNESKGGVAFQAHYLANVLVQRGHDVTMFTFSPAYADCRYQVNQYSVSPRLHRWQAFIFAARLANTDFSGFDIIHAHGDNYLLWGRHPQIRTFHGSAKDEALSAVRLRRRLYQSVMVKLEQMGAWIADINVGVSQATQARIPAISAIIPCGVDTTCFKPGCKAENPSVLFVGAADGRKRGKFLADVFIREVRSRFPEAELWMVTETPILGEGIVNFGKVSLETLCELYQRAWVFCLPSTYEGFGVPYIEAMAAGTVVISSPNPGAREVLGEGKYGLLADDINLGNQINRLLNDEKLRHTYETRGLLRAQEFSWEQIAMQYEKLYTALHLNTQKKS